LLLFAGTKVGKMFTNLGYAAAFQRVVPTGSKFLLPELSRPAYS